jgi:hypothetical protein
MFLTLTCPSYGKVREDGTPIDPGAYDYERAARDAPHFAALFDRFIQNLRRVLGHDVQYFATIEPQKRLAPHVYIAMCGTVSRAELRQIIVVTYHQVCWPSTDHVRFEGDCLPVWHEASGRATSTPRPESCSRSGTSPWTLLARTMTRDMWRGSRPSSTRRASSPGPDTQPGVSAT